jgi:hypothetical protein
MILINLAIGLLTMMGCLIVQVLLHVLELPLRAAPGRRARGQWTIPGISPRCCWRW